MRNTRTKMKAKHPAAYKSPTDNQLMDYIYLPSASSSSVSSLSSNLSPLAPPFTVERSNNPNSKLNSNQNPDSVWPNYHSPLTTTTTTQGFLTDSIRTATTLPYANSTPSPHNDWSSMDTSFKLGREPINGNLFNSSIYFNPFNAPSTTNNWISNPKPNNAPASHNWSSMNSSIKSGLEPVNQPADHLFGVKPNNLLPTSWNFGDEIDGDDGPLNLNPNYLDSFRDDVPSQVDYGMSLSGLKYSGQVDGSRGKDNSMFGGGSGFPKEKNIGSSTIGKSFDTSFSATNHGFNSNGFSSEDTFTWNGQSSSRYAFETQPLMNDTSSDHISTSMTRSSPSVVIKPPATLSSFPAQVAVSTKSIEISTPSKYSNKSLVTHNPLKEKESHCPLGFEAKESNITSNLLNLEIHEPNKAVTDRPNFEFKATSNFQFPDINIKKDVNSAANLSENLDQSSSEDSPCWQGAPTQFSSPSSSIAESSQLPTKKLQKSNGEDVLLPEMNIQTTDGTLDQNKDATAATAATFVGAEMLDMDLIVKALSNFSELLLLQCSKDKNGLKEQDHKTLDHVIGNLNMCMSRKPQQVDASPSFSERNNTQTAIDIEKVQNISLREDDLPKDYNMIQMIKKVLDENLDCKEDLSSESVLYKNLWLEAEAELCTSSYRARFHRAKKEMGKLKASDNAKVLYVSEVTSDTKKIPSSMSSSIALKSMPETAGSKTSNTHSVNPLPRVDGHIDDTESSVMARFNILKQRGESISVSLEKKEPVTVKASGTEIHSSGVARELHLYNHLGEDDAVVMNSHGNQRMDYPLAMGTDDLEQSVRARFNILKHRGETDPDNLEHEVLADSAHAGVSEEEIASGSAGGSSLMLNRFESGLYTTYSASSDWEYIEKK
uniref:uncharacterized protein LOC122602943 isoform X2 n=1 Tax=Erigeron canadensis TaxID=72917 RepID=UPI001CB9D75A|nr:uncharacterized protein LOC122602943 isoform X2 [Erigeron canadensis]